MDATTRDNSTETIVTAEGLLGGKPRLDDIDPPIRDRHEVVSGIERVRENETQIRGVHHLVEVPRDDE